MVYINKKLDFIAAKRRKTVMGDRVPSVQAKVRCVLAMSEHDLKT